MCRSKQSREMQSCLLFCNKHLNDLKQTGQPLSLIYTNTIFKKFAQMLNQRSRLLKKRYPLFFLIQISQEFQNAPQILMQTIQPLKEFKKTGDPLLLI